MNNPALTIDNVSACYELHKSVLAGVSLEVAEGEIVALLGPSGCGKSTLLLLLGGFLSVTDGALTYRGQPVNLPDSQRILLTQTDSTWPWKSALENVAYPLRCQGYTRANARATAVYWLDAVGLGGSVGVYPGELSGGMRQRVGVAKVFALRPKLLLLDEPFGALDEFTRQSVNQVFLNLWRENRMTVMLVTHSLNEAIFLADRLVVLGGKPARVVGDFRVPSPRPTQIEDTFSPEADALRVKVLRLLEADGRPAQSAAKVGKDNK